jgi:type IV secretory pathway VirB2 component (pilin)
LLAKDKFICYTDIQLTFLLLIIKRQLMINLVIKKIVLLSTLAFLVMLAPSIAGQNDAKASDSSSWIQVASVVSADATDNAFVDTLCNVFQIATGNGGKAFAAFAIISLGIGFFTGKVSWGLMLGVAAGIAAMFGAPTIVSAITGSQAFTCEGDFDATTGTP